MVHVRICLASECSQAVGVRSMWSVLVVGLAVGALYIERGPPLSEIQNASIFSLDDVNEEEMNNLIDGTITDFR